MSLLFVPRPRKDQAEQSPCHYGPQDDFEYTPTPLTSDALKNLAASLPQPISHVRYSNRKNDYLFSDRESVCCPSLSSSPLSATSSTRVSLIHTPDEHRDIDVLIAPSSVLPEKLRGPAIHTPPKAGKAIPKGGLDFGAMFDIDNTGFRRDSTIDFLPSFDEIDDYVPDERTAARLEEERELEKARLLYEKELEDDYPVTVSRKPIMPHTLWMSQPRHIITPNFVPSPQQTELSIPMSGSNIKPSETSEFLPSKDSLRSLSPNGSIETASTASTDITVPSVGTIDVSDELVSTVFTYLSLNHGSMALKFDEELSIGSGIDVAIVKKDREAALRVYIERYVALHPDVEL